MVNSTSSPRRKTLTIHNKPCIEDYINYSIYDYFGIRITGGLGDVRFHCRTKVCFCDVALKYSHLVLQLYYTFQDIMDVYYSFRQLWNSNYEIVGIII